MRQDDDTIDQFVTRVRQQVALCEFKNPDEAIIDQLIEGLRSQLLRERILDKGDKQKLDDIIETCRAFEVSRAQARNFEDRSSNVNRIKSGHSKQGYGSNQGHFSSTSKSDGRKHFTHKKNTDGHNSATGYPQNPTSQARSTPNVRRCFRCDSPNHLANFAGCPARSVSCSKCKSRGHYARCCKQKNVNALSCETPDPPPSDDHNYSFSLNPDSHSTVQATVGGQPMQLIVDTGSNVNVIDRSTWEDLKSKGIKCKSWPVEEKLFAYGQKDGFDVIGKFSTERILASGIACVAEFVVFEGHGDPIMSRKTAIDLNLVEFNVNTLDSKTLTDSVKQEFKSVFEGLGKLRDF